MLTTFAVIFPVFALIFCGWWLRKAKLVSQHATTELNKFVILLALPALLFDIVATAKWQELWQPGFIVAFLLGTLGLFVVTVFLQKLRGDTLENAAINGLNSSYANTGFMGFPLLLALQGQASQTYVLSATIITVCILFAISIILLETGLSTQQKRSAMLLGVTKRLIKNPIIIAPACAALLPLFDVQLPRFAHASLTLLGNAAAPCALVTIGLFLADNIQKRPSFSVNSIVLVATKLLLQPLLVFLLAYYVLALPSVVVFCAVLISALPTGTGPFMLAEYYRLDCRKTADVILLSTVLSPFTLTAILMLFTECLL